MNKFKIISFLILTSFSSFSFAGAAEDRTQSIIDKAISTRSYSSATGHNFTVGGVKAANGQVSADITQRVTVDGSSASVKQKVSIPANDAFYKNTGKYAKNILKGGIGGAIAIAALDKLLDGVGYVMGEGGQITRPPSATELINYEDKYDIYTSPYTYTRGFGTYYSLNQLGRKTQWASEFVSITQTRAEGRNVYATLVLKNTTAYDYPLQRSSNPFYNPALAPPAPTHKPATDPEINDAFSNWFKNNPKSVTDPVTTYIYSPKTSTGAALTTPQNNPTFGQQEITDEMMNNYLTNRNQELYANDVAANQAAIRDSAQTQTESNPDGTTTTTKNNPDGSKTETKTETKTNPDTGQVETTVTETVINPDGIKQPSKVTETKTETKPNPETSKLPAACEYFAVLCDWIGWTKENPNTPDEDPLQPQELDIGSLNTGTFQATAGCPADIQVPVSFGGASKSIAISYEPICALAQKWSFIAPLIGFISGAMILIGVGRKGEDCDS